MLSGGRHQSAADLLVQATALQPASVAAHFLLGNAHQFLGKLAPALESYQSALTLNPQHVDAHNNMGGAYQYQGRLDHAIACYRRALTLKPDYPEALNNLGGALQLQGKLDESIACYRRALALRPYYPDANSSLLMALAGSPAVSPAEYLNEARLYGTKMRARAKPFTSWPAGAQAAGRGRVYAQAPPVSYADLLADPHAGPLSLLRVGLVSGELRMNPVGYFLESILAHIDPARIQLLAFPTNRREDALTARLKPRFASWHDITGLDDAAAARTIHTAAPHILIDLAGHTVHNRLPVFAWKPAPVQVSWLGYFASTGVPGMDYLVADPLSVPEARRGDYSESVWNLPATRLCFTPPAGDAALAATPLPALRNGFVTFGSFQRLTKFNDTVLAAWGRILHTLPAARLRLQMIEMRWPEAREQLILRLETFGIARTRITVLPEVARPAYLAAHSEIDMILDTFPFPGGTTTCEALWMGVPTLTLKGSTLLARQGASLMTAAGLPGWVAESADDYVSRAIAHATAIGDLAQLRSQLRSSVMASPLCNASRFARHLEHALHGMWQQHAAQLTFDRLTP